MIIFVTILLLVVYITNLRSLVSDLRSNAEIDSNALSIRDAYITVLEADLVTARKYPLPPEKRKEVEESLDLIINMGAEKILDSVNALETECTYFEIGREIVNLGPEKVEEVKSALTEGRFEVVIDPTITGVEVGLND